MGLFNLFKTQIFYLRIKENKMELRNITKDVQGEAFGKFSNTRIAIAHFIEAEETFRNLLKSISNDRNINGKPLILVQQLDKSEGGLSSVEKRALEDLLLHGGMYKVYIDDSKEKLSDEKVLELLNEKGYAL